MAKKNQKRGDDGLKSQPVIPSPVKQAASKQVILYSIPRKTATGLHKFTNPTSNKSLGKTKHGRCTTTIQALYSPKIGGLKNHISYTPWIEGGEQVQDSEGNYLTLQDKEEKFWNLPKGYLTNRAWRKGDPHEEDQLTFFQKTSWALPDGAKILDLSKFEDRMCYYTCLGSKYVANSEREWREHKFPEATHYIAVENETEQLKYLKRQKTSKAFATLHSSHLTPSLKKDIAVLLGLARVTADLTEEAVHNLLYEFIENNSAANNNIDKFMNWSNMAKTPTGKEEIAAQILLEKAVRSRVLYEKQGTYTWVRADGSVDIGSTKKEAIEFILNPKKSALIDELKSAISFKLK